MIHVPRGQQRAGVPIQPGETWFEQAKSLTEKAILEMERHEVQDHYRHDEVRRSLAALFHQKCAYCEQAVESWDVEHYRPKGAVSEIPGHPGYYWLAYTWGNLYPACPRCNQRRRDIGTFDDPSGGPTRGKGTQFPLEDEETRAREPGREVAERRLLLDPCQDRPEHHLRFGIRGEVFHATRMGQVSIDVLGLDRRVLTKRRHRRLGELIEAVAEPLEVATTSA